MTRRQEIPDQLKRGPFTVGDAERLGFSRQRLRGPNWRRLGWGAYTWAGRGETENDELATLVRPDLLYPEARLAIEYDGANHRNRLVADNRRQNPLQRAGYSMLRFTAPDVSDRPHAVLADVSAELTRLTAEVRTPARALPSG
jgi:hypothetical protein